MNPSNPSPVTLEIGAIVAPSRNVPRSSRLQVAADLLDAVGRRAVDLRQRDHAVPDAEQRQDVEVLAGLRHDPVIGRHDQEHRVHAGGAGDHRLDEMLVAGNVDDADLQARDQARREPEFDRHAAFVLLLQAVGLAARQEFDKGGLAVVDVTGGAERDVGLRALASSACATRR